MTAPTDDQLVAALQSAVDNDDQPAIEALLRLLDRRGLGLYRAQIEMARDDR